MMWPCYLISKTAALALILFNCYKMIFFVFFIAKLEKISSAIFLENIFLKFDCVIFGIWILAEFAVEKLLIVSDDRVLTTATDYFAVFCYIYFHHPTLVAWKILGNIKKNYFFLISSRKFYNFQTPRNGKKNSHLEYKVVNNLQFLPF